MLDLKNTTLLFVETRAHEITKRVIDDCISKVNFGDILLYTDKPDLIPIPGARCIPCVDFPNKKEAGRFYYSEAMREVNTDFALMLEWDAGIFDTAKWLPEFFNYDYIGAPWTVRPGDPYDVGNGGFTLMSTKLGQFICENARKLPVFTDMDVCRTQRRHFEAAGFKWPGRDLASLFAWELGIRNPEHFGYHGAFNWPTVLPRAEVVERARLMLKSEYLTIKMRDVLRSAPWLVSDLGAEAMGIFHDRVPPGYVLKPTIPGMLSPQQRALMQVQRRGLVTYQQNKGLKA